ncbi:MAG: hypothetical protein AB8B48_05140 [Pseudomonadales bacterium]
MINERAINFDKNRLSGVLTTAADADAAQPVFVLLNAGLLHKVGSFRMNVEIARALADQGVSTFRFDLSRIGDSKSSNHSGDYQASVIHDIACAFDELSKLTQAQKFVVVGLCTGADNAHRIAVADPRVCGAVFVDGYAYPTLKFRAKRLLSAVSSAPRLLKIIRDRLPFRAHSQSPITANSEQAQFEWTLPPKLAVETELELLIDRGVQMLFIFTGAARGHYNYQQQMSDSFAGLDFGTCLTVRINSLADHSFCLSSDRQTLVADIIAWFSSNGQKKTDS